MKTKITNPIKPKPNKPVLPVLSDLHNGATFVFADKPTEIYLVSEGFMGTKLSDGLVIDLDDFSSDTGKILIAKQTKPAEFTLVKPE